MPKKDSLGKEVLAEEKKIQEELHSRKKFRLLAIATLIGMLLVTGAVVMRTLEGWSWIDSFYFAAVTLATVGYGDLIPTNPLSKIFVTAYLLAGVATFLYGVNVLAQHYVQRREDQIEHSLREIESIVGNKEHKHNIKRKLSIRRHLKIRK